jgi:hypothetical protein
MSLIFTLLQKDYIVLASDSRHTRAEDGCVYKNNRTIKALPILNGRGILGFAGHDITEQIVYTAQESKMLDGPSLRDVGQALSRLAAEKYQKIKHWQPPPIVQIVMASFEPNANGEQVANSCLIQCERDLNIHTWYYLYGYDQWFQIIGQNIHGALYALHRFGNRNLPEIAALRLSSIILCEICECDTTVGGQSQIYIIPKNGKCKLADNIPALEEQAKDIGAFLGKMIINGPVPPTPKT